MISFLSVETFRTSIGRLLKRLKDGYISVKSDICKAFAGRSIEEIRNSREMIYDSEEFLIVKLRVKDGHRKLSGRDGYRLIYLVLKKEKTVVLLDVFPKRGAHGKTNINDTELKALLKEYAESASSSSLICHDIHNDLEQPVSIMKENVSVKV